MTYIVMYNCALNATDLNGLSNTKRCLGKVQYHYSVFGLIVIYCYDSINCHWTCTSRIRRLLLEGIQNQVPDPIHYTEHYVIVSILRHHGRQVGVQMDLEHGGGNADNGRGDIGVGDGEFTCFF